MKRVRLFVLLSLVCGGAVAGQAPPQPLSATAAISGTVKDGATGTPLAGAIVALRFPSNMPASPMLARIQRQVTDASGRFVFRGLPAGQGYTLAASRPGYGDAAYGQTMVMGPAGVVSVQDKGWFARADITMWKRGAIGGRVLDEVGEPIVGVYVRALARVLIGGQPQLLAGPVAKTDDRGEYRIAGLGPGQYLVHVPSVQTSVPVDAPAGVLGSPAAPPQFSLMSIPSTPRTDAVLDPVGGSRQVIGNFVTPPPAADGRSRAYAMAFHPSANHPDAAVPVTLGPSEDRGGVDVSLQPVAAAHVFGTAVGPPDALKGLLLRLVPAGLEGLANGAEAATALAGADGRFAFLNVPAGDYVIDAPGSTFELTYDAGGPGVALPQAPGLRLSGSQSSNLVSGPPGSGYVRRSGPRGDAYWARTTLSVGASDITGLTVTLHPAITLRGWIVYEGTTRTTVEQTPIAIASGGLAPSSTTTTTTTQRPATQPSFAAEPADANPRLGLPRSLRPGEMDPEDLVIIEGLMPGEYVLRSTLGAGRFTIKSITVDGADHTYAPIDAAALGPKSEVIITMTDKLTTLRGTVRDDRGPATSAAVLVFPVERTQWKRYGLTPARLRGLPLTGSADFDVSGLPAGDYFVVAVDQALVTMWQDPAFLERAAAVATRVSLAWGDERVVDLSLVRIR